MSEIVGRDEELASLHAFIDEVREGASALVLDHPPVDQHDRFSRSSNLVLQLETIDGARSISFMTTSFDEMDK